MVHAAHKCINEYDTPQTRGYERNSQACPVQWCPSIFVSTFRVALLLFNEIGRYVQVTITTWEKKQVVTVFTCQHNKIWKQRICRPFHSALMICCYTLIRGQLDPLEPMYVWKWCHCYHSYLIQDSDAQPCTSKLLWFMMHISNTHTCIQMLPASYINLTQAF